MFAKQLLCHRVPGGQILRSLKEWFVIVGICLAGSWLLSGGEALHAAPVTATAGSMVLSLSFNPDPPGVGQNQLTLTLSGPPSRSFADARVTFDSSMYTMNMPGPSATGTAAGPGRYRTKLLFGMGGPWQVTVHATRAGQSPASANFRFKIGDTPAAASSSLEPTPESSPSGPASHPIASTAGASDGMRSQGSRSSSAYEVSIDTTPPPIGQGLIVIHVRDKRTGGPVSGGKVIARASMPSMPMGETYHDATAVPGRPGEFQLPWSFQMAGDWEIKAQYGGPDGVADASAAVSPGSFALPLWAEVFLAPFGVVAILALLNMARTPSGRERLRGLAQGKNLAALLVLAVVAVGTWLLVRRSKAGQVDWNQMSMKMQDYTAPTPVSVSPVSYGITGDVLTYTGAVAPYTEFTVSPRVTGRILLAPYAGTRVSAGQVIVRMEAPDLIAKAVQSQYGAVGAAHDVIEDQDRVRQSHDAIAAARSSLRSAGQMLQQTGAKLRSARADAAYWESEIKRERFLLDHGAVSLDEYQSELDKARAATEAVNAAGADLGRALADQATAQANLNNAGHGLSLASHQVEHSYAMLNQSRAGQSEAAATASYLTIQAPVTGVVTGRMADPGAVAAPGTAILTLAELDRVRLQASVSPADIGKIRVGTPITAVMAGDAAPISARVTRILPAANAGSRTSVVEAVISNPNGRLQPGQFVTLQFHIQAAARTLMTPVTAIVSLAQASGNGAGAGTGGSGVWTAVYGTAHLVPVTLGASDGTNQQILGGLKAGDLVIVGGSEGLTEGAAISYPGMPQTAPRAGSPSTDVSANSPSASSQTSGLTQKTGDLTVGLAFQPSPPKVGDEQLQFTVKDGAGNPVKGATVGVKSEMPTMSMGGPSGTAKDKGDGTYSMPLAMGMGGPWRITASVTVPGKPAANAVFDTKAE